MKPFTRADRVGGLVQETLSDILRKDIKDPRLDMTVITGVRMSKDLRSARVFFSTSAGNKKKEDAYDGFESAMGYIKRRLARELDLRYMPKISFFYDESFDYGSHIDDIFRQLEIENSAS